ncbi:MAG TPA: sulfatase-like hydrolase/transferase [Blastocatellia bacterium]|nr:sulfatase-like hydrolase/transferase [Blastocatellia bacterium]
MSFPKFSITLSFSLFLFCSAFAQRKPNIIIILADDMGYADIEPYGAKDIRTPALNRLAREGVKLTNFYSNGPNCTPTRAGLMTGRWQQRVGLEWATRPTDKNAELPLSETTVASTLKNAGYATGIFGKWHLGYDIARGPVAHGFDEFFGLLTGNVDMYSHQYRTGMADLYEGTKPVEREGYLTDLLTEKSVDFISRHKAEPFFLYVPYNAVHWPFQVPGTPHDIRTLATWFDGTRQDYARMLERMDWGIGQILQALDQHKLSNDTLVVFTNDNGGERLSDNRPLFHHKSTLWEGGIRVPCLLRWPGKLPAEFVSEQMAITMDLTATAVAMANAQAPKPLDGVNLLPLLQRNAKPQPRTFFWRINQPGIAQKAVRSGQWKYVQEGENELLFDLRRDIGERDDLRYRRPDIVAALRAQFAGWEKDVSQSPVGLTR